jgi:predicted ATPase
MEIIITNLSVRVNEGEMKEPSTKPSSSRKKFERKPSSFKTNNEITNHEELEKSTTATEDKKKLLHDTRSNDRRHSFQDLVSTRSTSFSFDSSCSTSSSQFLSSKRSRKSDILSPRSSRLSGATEYRRSLTTDFQTKLRRLQQQERLYGRQSEVEQLIDIFQNEIKSSTTNNDNPGRREQRRPKLIQISGVSGVGKSALARCLQRPTARAGGIYAVGKYDFLAHRGTPHQGITEACQEICNVLIKQKRDSDEQSQRDMERLRMDLGWSVKILGKILPQLYNLADAADKSNDINPDENDDDSRMSSEDIVSHKMSGAGTTIGNGGHFAETDRSIFFALGRFLKTVSALAPLVIVLDDVQWADRESFRLLETITNDVQTQDLFIVLCYRSDEVDTSRYLSLWLNDLQHDTNRMGRLTNFHLSNLDVNAVSNYLADILTSDVNEISELASIVHKKTLGNPFFVQQYVITLQEKGIIDFNIASSTWSWTVEEVLTETDATDNVVDQLKKKMEMMPTSYLEIIPVAACLGTSFTESLLAVVAENLCDSLSASMGGLDAKAILQLFMDAGFLEKPSDVRYRWVHDKIREAALGIVLPEELVCLQVRVGKVLLERLSPQDLSEQIFLVVGLLNRGKGQRETIDDLVLARLNLKAGRAAINVASFEEAENFLRVGIQCLPKDNWEKEYDLSLELYSLAADMAYRIGNFEYIELCCGTILLNAKSLEDKFRANLVSLSALASQNMAQKALDTALPVLSEYGIHFPRRLQLLSLIKEVVKLKILQRKLCPEDIASLPMMSAAKSLQVMYLLQNFVVYTFHANSPLMLIAIMKMFDWTIKYGVSELAPVVLSTIAVIYANKLKVRYRAP